MRHELAMTKNVMKFMQSVSDLQNQSGSIEGMGLLWGLPGEGKTTVVAYYATVLDAVYIRAMSTWTTTGMLGAMMTELGHEPARYRKAMIDTVIEELMKKPRPIFIDEADYLLRSIEMTDTVRDIYDVANVPVILIGMEAMARKLQRHGRFARRVTQWIEFRGIDTEDTVKVADTCCEIRIEKDLLIKLHTAARANIGRIVSGMAKIEQFARTNRLDSITAADWGTKKFFYDQPKFTRG